MKLKDLLKETKVWERKFGEPLPTLDSVMRKHQGNSKDEAKEINEFKNEKHNFYDDIVKGEVELMLEKSLSTLKHALDEISNYSLSYAGDQNALYFMTKKTRKNLKKLHAEVDKILKKAKSYK
jgi:hypothetical protein